MKRKTRFTLYSLLFVSLLGTSMIFLGSTVVNADTDVTSFDAWRPWSENCGCHSSTTNSQGTGIVEISAPEFVKPGEEFTVKLRVVGFTDAAGGAITIGLHIDDMDNGDFIDATVAEPNHGVDGSGDSTDWTTSMTLTAPDTPGDYSLLSYGVDGLGSTAEWKWVMGVTSISVTSGAHSSLSTYIESAADYLIGAAVEDNGGLKWPEFNGSAAKYKTAYLKGAAGIGELFLELYESAKTDPFFTGVAPGAEEYLDIAKGAATWLMAQAISENGGYKWARDLEANNDIAGASANYTGMYDGAAGIGTFFIDMYQTTGDATYLGYAEGAAIWIESIANTTVGLRFTEADHADTNTTLSTRWTYGSPGIGGFFIDLYLATGDTMYAGWANATAEGLIYNALTDEGGYSWTRYNNNTERYVGRWHGAAGIAIFFMEMYDLYTNATYLSYAEGIATWIDSTHEVDDGYFYPDDNAAGTKSYKLGGWSRSAAGIGSMFLRLNQVTGTQSYLDYTTEIADFLSNNATLTSTGGLTWADSNSNDRIATALGHGLAGTGMFFVEAYQATGNSAYAAVIQGITQTLGDMAVETENGTAWTQSDQTSDVHMGLYYGVAGVTKFLNLAAHSGMPYADELDDSLDYLLSVGVEDSGGMKWAEFNGSAAKYKTSYLKGAAGIGSLFLQVYQQRHGDSFFAGIMPTANTYLDAAIDAATWLKARAISENGGYKWARDLEANNDIAGASANYTGMYDGAAGIGTFFLDMYRTTGDASYLAHAEGAAIWLESIANKTVGLRFTEADNADMNTTLSTRWTYGSPGIGGFFVNLYLATGDTTYSGWANATAEGLIYNALTDEGGYSWTRYNNNTERYVGRWHGATGIATFFVEMYDLTNNATFLNYAEGTADWIYGTHEEDQGDYYPDNNATATKSYKLGGWSRSPAGIGDFFGRLYQTTGDSNYRDYMTEAMDFLVANATDAYGGSVWRDSNSNDRVATSLGHGISGTGMFMVEGYRIVHDSVYYDTVSSIVDAIAGMSNTESEGASWTQSNLTSDVHFGLYYGVAGVGQFLLRAQNSYPITDFDAPIITNPADLAVEVDDVASISWVLSDLYPSDWSIDVDGAPLTMGTYTSGETVQVSSVDTSAAGTFTYTITATDFFGRESIDVVIVSVTEPTTTGPTTTDTTTTTTTNPPGAIPFEFQAAMYASLGLNVVLVIGVVMLLRKR